ncbi:MAG: glycosyltransferase family 61 protein [Bacteroidetes bacterium]|nr:MAG: glycosyltransferase family 61 protein [Bacteroidota bacterium]
MIRHIKVDLPLNLAKDDSCVFKNSGYDLAPLKVSELRNVIITYDGVCLSDCNLVKESIYGYRDKITIYTLTSKLDLLNHDTYQLNDSNSYLLIHSPLFSYYHWLTESIPRLLLVKSQIKDLTLLLPDSLKNVGFVQYSLKPFSFKNIVYIPKKTNMKVRHLILPQIKPYFTSYYPEVVNEVRNLYTEYLKNHPVYTKNLHGRIFLCNKKEVINIFDVRSLLDQYNFKYLDIQGCSFFELVQFMNKTKFIISADADNFACINFMNKGTSVLELIRKQTNDINKPDLRFLYLASNLELKYYYQFCSPLQKSSLKIYSKIKVDIKLLKKNIDLIMMNQAYSVN